MAMHPASDREFGVLATLGARRDGRVKAEATKRRRKAELAQDAVPAILSSLLADLLTTVRLCDRCVRDHFQPQPEYRARDCLNVRCGCWCTTRRDQ